MSLIGNRLREARERKNLKQTQVMAKTGINNKTLSGYEKGVSEPDLETLRILSELYGVSVDWLSGKDKTKEDHRRDLINFLNDPNSTIDGKPIPNELRETLLGYVRIEMAKDKLNF